MRFPALGRALRHRNYRLFFAGQGVSLVGSWLTRVATSWLTYRLTGSAWMLGLVGFAGQIPTFLLAPFAGVWVDRWNRYRTIVATQALAMVQSGLLAFFALSGTIDVEHILALSLLQGVINAFDIPARQAFVVDMLESRADLPNAIALNSSMFNAARLIGPSIGGILIAAFGEGMCFLLDSVSYVGVLAALLAMRVAPQRPRPPARVLTELADGLRYALGFAPIRSLLGLLAVIGLLGMPYTVLMPIFAGRVLGGGPNTLGFLMAAAGVGALSAAMFLASRASVLGLGRVLVRAGLGFGAGLVALGLCRSVWLALALLFVVGLSMMAQTAACNTVLQTIVDEDKRGRVMSLYSMAFVGTAPLGSLLAGAAADGLGVPATFALGGLGCILSTLLFWRALPGLRALVRPIYARLGVIQELASGVQSASEPTLRSSPP